MIITKEPVGVVALQQRERRDEAGEAAGLQDGMDGRGVTPVDWPAAVTQCATGGQDADMWPISPSGSLTPPALQLFPHPLLQQLADGAVRHPPRPRWHEKR